MVWSYSRLKAFETCPYGWYLKYIDGADSEPKFYSSYGSFVHRILADFYNGKIPQERLSEEFITKFSDEVQGVRPSGDIVSGYVRKGIAYFENFKPFPLHTLLVEDDKTFDYFGVQFRGIIDYVGIDEESGEIYLIDHKSRDLKPRSNRKMPTQNDRDIDDMLRQLYVYSERIRQEFGTFPAYLCFNCFKNGEFIKEPFRKEVFRDTVRWVKDLIREIQDEKSFPPNDEYFKCTFLCDCVAECDYF